MLFMIPSTVSVTPLFQELPRPSSKKRSTIARDICSQIAFLLELWLEEQIRNIS
jgi:hypothetical protein